MEFAKAWTARHRMGPSSKRKGARREGSMGERDHSGSGQGSGVTLTTKGLPELTPQACSGNTFWNIFLVPCQGTVWSRAPSHLPWPSWTLDGVYGTRCSFVPWTAWAPGRQQTGNLRPAISALFPAKWPLGGSALLCQGYLRRLQGWAWGMVYLYEGIAHLEFMLEVLWSLGNMQERVRQAACLRFVFCGGKAGLSDSVCDQDWLLVPRNRLSQEVCSGLQQGCFSYRAPSLLP